MAVTVKAQTRWWAQLQSVNPGGRIPIPSPGHFSSWKSLDSFNPPEGGWGRGAAQSSLLYSLEGTVTVLALRQI